MVDTLTKEQRSAIMGRVRGKDTAPEMLIRRLLHSLGYRYRLHGRNLPGRPDLVFATRRKVIFIHGCFWHRHEGCALSRMPKSRTEFWTKKLEGNKQRDARNETLLKAQDWEIMTVWECQLSDVKSLRERLVNFLGP